MSKQSKTANAKRVRFWKKHIKEWSQTELTQNAYCRKYNLRPNQFTYWKNKFNKKNLPVEFVQAAPVQLEAPLACHSSNILKLNIKSEFQIEVPNGFSQITLERLLKVVA
jgi:hypothetical protein